VSEGIGFRGALPDIAGLAWRMPPQQDLRSCAFDPALHSDPEVKLVPGWLGDFRRAAYRRSREGRDAQ
jgi:hypothetical protein